MSIVSLRRFLGRAQQVGQGVGPTRWLLRDPCPYCGGKADSKEHLIPKIKGGLGLPNNTVGACTGCNSRRGSRPFLIWMGLRDGTMVKVEEISHDT